MAYPTSDSFHYTPKVPPEPTCPCYYQQLPFCCCAEWIHAGAETADFAVPEATTTPPSAATSAPSPTSLPLCGPPFLFPDLLFPAADHQHHHHQPLVAAAAAAAAEPDPASPWSPVFHAASPAASAADFSSSGGSPAGGPSLAGSPENYALSPASTALAWPGSGYGDFYSPSPVPSETM